MSTNLVQLADGRWIPRPLTREDVDAMGPDDFWAYADVIGWTARIEAALAEAGEADEADDSGGAP